MTHEEIDPIVAQVNSIIEFNQSLITQLGSLVTEAPAAPAPAVGEAPAAEAAPAEAPVAPETPAPTE